MNDKMTIMKALDYVLTNCDLPEDVHEKIENVKTSYGKRSTSRKSVIQSDESIDRMNAITNCMEQGVEYTVSEIIALVPALSGLNTQKVAPLMKALVTEERVVKTEGRISKYRLA